MRAKMRQYTCSDCGRELQTKADWRAFQIMGCPHCNSRRKLLDYKLATQNSRPPQLERHTK